MSGVLHGVVVSLKAAAAAATDTFFRYVSLLLNTTSTNGAQNNTFLDASTNNFTITRNGNTTQGSFTPYMPNGYWGAYFDGNGDELNAGSNAAFAFGTGAYTVEAWVYLTAAISATHRPIIVINNTTNGFGFYNPEVAGNLQIVINGGASVLTSNTNLTPNIWNHVVAVRSGTGANQTSIFINGLRVANGTDANNWTVTGPLQIGGLSLSTYYLNGYMSNVRVVKGTAVYDPTLTTLTVPTTPLTAITNTSLLACQSNRFIDNSTNAFAITVNGDSRISKFSPFSPPASYDTATYGGSGYFDGTGDYLIAPTNAAFDFASGNFTVELWFYSLIANSNYQRIFGINVGGPIPTESIVFEIDANGVGMIAVNGTTGYGAITKTPLAPNTWHHLALVRNGNTVTGYINGVSAGSSTMTVAVNFGTGAFPQIGAWQQSGSYSRFINGYISSLRIVKGTAVYTTDFTPPSTPLTAITNTSLLLNCTNGGIYDATTINDAETVGSAQVSTTVAKFGTTSMAFDGTGDWLTVLDKPELRLGTGAFTIEMWVYRSASGTYGLVSKGTATTGWSVSLNASNQVVFSFAASSFNSTGTVAATTWTYIAVVREGTGANQTKIYIDGTNDGTGTVSTDFNQTNVMYVGADRAAGSAFNGYIDELRITNGVARYTSNFTPPTAAFPTQ